MSIKVRILNMVQRVGGNYIISRTKGSPNVLFT